jgi:hypothetical protein
MRQTFDPRRVTSPRHGSSPLQNVCGGAQRSVSLATGHFTGESTRNPPGSNLLTKLLYINTLDNDDLTVLDSFAESTHASLRKPPWMESRTMRISAPPSGTSARGVRTSVMFALFSFHRYQRVVDWVRYGLGGRTQSGFDEFASGRPLSRGPSLSYLNRLRRVVCGGFRHNALQECYRFL